MNWETVKLGDVLPFVYGKNLPAPRRNHDGEFPVISSAGVIDHHDESLVEGPAVVVGRKGSVGTVYYSDGPCWPTDTAFYVLSSDAMNIRFAYYLLKSLPLAMMNNDSAVPGLNRGDAEGLTVSIPEDVKYQQQVASILGVLDDKIAVNKKVVDVSIQLAESIVNHGASSWAPLESLADITMGSSPKGEYLHEQAQGLPFYQGVRDFGEVTPSKRVFATNWIREAESGDILLAVRAPVGSANLAVERTAIGRGLAALRAKSHPISLFYMLRSNQNIWDEHQGSGTVFSSVNKHQVHSVGVPVVDEEYRDDIENRIGPMHAMVMVLIEENQRLAQTRDELLPLLMDGRITVKDAERVAEEV